MTKTQRNCLLWLTIIGLIYFAAMIPFTRSGAENPEMLEVFEVDEYAQYPHLIRMLSSGNSIYQTLRNFVIYQHYFYGYPFYFWSAICILPVKVFSAIWPPETRMTVCILRQMLSVLPMILSAGLFCWIATHFKRRLSTIGLFIFYLSVPAVILNNFWWHPDSLTLLFLALTFFFLDRDCLNCGKNFLYAAAACGAAIGTKYLGLYFALAIPVYLQLCLRKGSLTWQKALNKALLFLLIMLLFILISAPLLLLPQERSEILRTMQTQIGLSGEGVFIRYSEPFLENGKLPSYITEYFARGWFLLLSVLALLAGLLNTKERQRTNAWLVLAYCLVAAFININTPARRIHYFLPLILPLFSLIPGAIQTVIEHSEKQKHKASRSSLPSVSQTSSIHFSPVIMAACVLLCVPLFIQFALNLRLDYSLLDTQWWRESNSSSIKLYTQIREEALPTLNVPAERMTRVYRDWKIYFPEQENIAIKTDWEMATQALIDEWQPDIIILENANITEFAKEESLTNAVDLNHMQQVHNFYLNAQSDSIPGYRRAGGNKIGVFFVKNTQLPE